MEYLNYDLWSGHDTNKAKKSSYKGHIKNRLTKIPDKYS